MKLDEFGIDAGFGCGVNEEHVNVLLSVLERKGESNLGLSDASNTVECDACLIMSGEILCSKVLNGIQDVNSSNEPWRWRVWDFEILLLELQLSEGMTRELHVAGESELRSDQKA